MRWIKLAGFALLAAAGGWWALQVALLEPNERSTASGYGQFALAILGVLILAAGPVRKAFTAGPAIPVDELADLLALAMRNQWEKAARDRRLLEPAPLPIRWCRSTLPVAVPVTAATAAPARFDPLPGLSAATPTDLREGDRTDLHTVYGGLGSGRLVIAGPAGSGKSAAAILLLLDSLRYRELHGPSVPVPVIFTLHGWDPNSTPLRDWLLTKLTEIPLLRKRGADTLLDAGRLAIFLDGLDEIPEDLRPTALQALSDQATFRLVLLTRSAELVVAAERNPLLGAAAIDLQPISPADAADYLLRPLVSPPPPAWQALADTLTHDPVSPLTRALDNPLTLSLLRDTGLTANLTDTAQFPSSTHIENHLLDHALITAYTPRPGQPPPRYSLESAKQTLGFIARRLNEETRRDLSWWSIAGWGHRPAMHATIGIIGFVSCGTLAGYFGVRKYEPSKGIGLALIVAAFFGAMFALASIYMRTEPRRTTTSWWRALFRPATLSIGLTVGTLCAVLTWFTLAIAFHNRLTVQLLLFAVIIGWFAFGFAIEMVSANSNDVGSLTPTGLWRRDVTVSFTIAGISGIFAFSLTIPISNWDQPDPFALGFSTVVVVMVWLSLSAAWRAFFAQIQLAVQQGTPLRLMRFLEDARERHVLRTVGPVYQFRHAKLQDRLAGGAWGGD